jgi:ACR3 family arsenite efflux pump ArsB
MLSRICRAAVPFLMFFIYLNLAFACVMEVIHISFDETATKVFMGEY